MTVLEDLEQDQGTSTQHSADLAGVDSPPDPLAQFENTAHLDFDIHKFRLQRLEEAHIPVYIPPMAKANLQARDNDLFLLMEKVQEFLTSERQVMLILGDSGAGKSTFNKHLESELLRSFQNNDPFPLFINLPAIHEPEVDMIAKHLYLSNFTEEQIRELKQHCQFIVICDGYDESQQKINLYRTNMLNQPGQWSAKMIISCRSQYLGQDYHSQFMPQASDKHFHLPNINLFQEAVIAPFSKEQIETYVEKYVPLEPRTWTTKDYMDKLTNIPNLMDLVRNPFLLLLALESLPFVTEGKQDLLTINITRVQLYDIFVEHWLNVNKRRLESNTLSTEDRDVFDQLLDAGFIFMGIGYSTRLATAIFEKQDGNPVIRYIHLQDKNTWRVDFFGPDPEVRLMRESSPLTRSGSLFQFLHRSMQEYFYSRTVFDPSSHGELHEFPPQPNSCSTGFSDSQTLDTECVLFKRNLLAEPSVIQFLCERVKQHPDFKRQLLTIIEQSKSDSTVTTAAANAITILVRAGVRFNSADIRGIKIPGADLSDGQFDSAQFQGADLTNVNFARSWLRQADISHAQMSGMRFGELPLLKAEDDVIESSAFSPDGKMFAVGLRRGDIEMYDTTTWEMIRGLGRRKQDVWRMAISPNNRHIISTSGNNALRLWDITSGKTVHVMQGHNEQVISVAFSPCGKQIASSGYDKTVRLWSAETGKEMLVLVDHTENVNIVKYAPDGRRLVSGGSDKTVRFWDPETGQPGPVCYASLGRVLSLDYSPDGRRVVSGHSRRDVCLWDANSGDLVFAISNNLGAVRCVAFSPDGKWIVSSGYDPIVHMWDSSTGHLIFKVSGHFRPVEFCAFSPNGLQIASREVGGIVRLWEVNSRTSTLSNSNNASGGVSTVAFSLDGRSILSCNLGRGIQRQSTLTGAYESITITMEQEGLRSFALSPNGRAIATGGRAGTIQLWDSQTEAAERILVGETMSADILVYSPCGRWIVSTHWNEVVQLWDLHDSAGQSHVICKATDTSMVALFVDIYVAFSPLGHHFVVATRCGLIQLFEPQSKNSCNPVKVMTCASNVSSLIYKPDGQGLVFGTTSGSLLFWDLQSRTVEAELKGHQDKVTCITYSPCGRWILSGSKDRTIRIWQLRTVERKDWHCIVVIRGCSGPITCLAWNPVTPMEFVSGSIDGSVRVWRMASQDDGVAYVRMLWGNDVGRLCTSDLMFKGAIGLSPINRQLLLQRGAVVDPLPSGEEGDDGFNNMEIED